MCGWLKRSAALAVLILVAAGCNLSTTAPTPYPTPDLPRVEFLAPVNGSRVFDGAELDVELLAQDDTAGISRVELLVDDQPQGESQPEANSVPVYRVLLSWRATGIGVHPLTAIAYRADGTPSDPVTILVEVVSR
ncbi:MAG: Ig-like domain-containing protein [Anaerolineaceae bacterium]|nr:Ig-like domain-containing protein [Anaerolineaceae bacterium]